jgi:NitT/TauT family transport system substrate-binding protein
MKTRRADVLSTFAVSALAVALPRSARAQGAEKISVAGTPVEGLTPLYYGIKTGMFARAGLDVEHVAANSGSAAMATVVSGTYQMSSTNLVSICTAHVRDIPISIVAPTIVYTPRSREALLQIAVDSPYKTGGDLNGKTFGVASLVNIDTLAAKAWIDKSGGDSKSLKFLEIPNSAAPQALVQRRIDAAVIQPPVLDASLAEGTSKTLADPMGAIASTYMISAYVARTDWAQQHGDALRRFNRVLTDAAKYVNTHHAETASLVADITKIELSVVQKMYRTLAGTSLDGALIQPLIDTAAKYELLPRAFPARDLVFIPGGR